MTARSVFKAASVSDGGDLDLVVETDGVDQTITIRAARASDALVSILTAVARVSEKPGSPYRTLLKPHNVGLERVPISTGIQLPALLLQFEEAGGFLRIALRPDTLRELGEGLLTLDRILRDQGASGRAH